MQPDAISCLMSYNNVRPLYYSLSLCRIGCLRNFVKQTILSIYSENFVKFLPYVAKFRDMFTKFRDREIS
jgi:hypothetical protein